MEALAATKKEIKYAINLQLVLGFPFCSCLQRAWYISLFLPLLPMPDIRVSVLNFGYSLDSPGKLKKQNKTQMLRTYSSPIKSETLGVGIL